MTAKALFQTLLISLILLWPVWALVIVILRWLIKKTGSILGKLKTELSTRYQRKVRPKLVDTLGHDTKGLK